VRLLTPGWWRGYAPRTRAAWPRRCGRRGATARGRRGSPHPLGARAPGAELAAYEVAMSTRSAATCGRSGSCSKRRTMDSRWRQDRPRYRVGARPRRAWPTAARSSAPTSCARHGPGPARPSTARRRHGGGGGRVGRHGGRVAGGLGNIGDPDAVAACARRRRGARRRGPVGELRRAATSAPAAPSPCLTTRSTSRSTTSGRDREQPDRHAAGVPGLRAPDARPRRRHGGQRGLRGRPTSASPTRPGTRP
jgi:hypothetical protein